MLRFNRSMDGAAHAYIILLLSLLCHCCGSNQHHTVAGPCASSYSPAKYVLCLHQARLRGGASNLETDAANPAGTGGPAFGIITKVWQSLKSLMKMRRPDRAKSWDWKQEGEQRKR
jgi:hypothetical protein